MKNTAKKSLSNLADLAQLSGLLVKTTEPESAADLVDTLQQKLDAQKATDAVFVSRETKGRGGKAVTLVKGISLPIHELEALGKQLKSACGSGGTVKEGVLEVQGDHRDKVVAMLSALGYKAKKAGG
jgi:translation initiation factor 1